MGNVVFYLYLHHGGARQNDGGYPNDIFPRFFRQRDVRKFGPRDAVFTSIQRRSTGVDFSPLEQANKSLLHALTVVGFIRFPLATRMRRLSKPKLHSYSVFPCARLAVAAVRVVELQLRRSLDRFGGPSLRRRACGASDDQTAKWPSTEYTRKICPESTGAQYQGQGFFGTSYLLLSWHS